MRSSCASEIPIQVWVRLTVEAEANVRPVRVVGHVVYGLDSRVTSRKGTFSPSSVECKVMPGEVIVTNHRPEKWWDVRIDSYNEGITSRACRLLERGKGMFQGGHRTTRKLFAYEDSTTLLCPLLSNHPFETIRGTCNIPTLLHHGHCTQSSVPCSTCILS